MCGEHRRYRFVASFWTGSSPHVRGAQQSETRWVSCMGIIPACAGSTRETRIPARANRDHPRMCGEHENAGSYLCGTMGSSPHVRGALRRGTPLASFFGIIPACAGSTPRRIRRRAAARDHPRMCGEHLDAEDQTIEATGSSPHVRGAHFTSRASLAHSRLTHSLLASFTARMVVFIGCISSQRDTCSRCSIPWAAARQAWHPRCRRGGG